jgi:sialic acid synthase SpsE
MGLIAQTDIPATGTLADQNVGYAFPTVGIPVEDASRVLGRRVVRAIRAGDPIRWSDVQL